MQLKSSANSKGTGHKKYGKKEDFCHWRQRGGIRRVPLFMSPGSFLFYIMNHDVTHYSCKCLVLLWVSQHMISYQIMGCDRSWESLLAQLLILASAIFAFDHLHHIFAIAISSPGLMSTTSSGQPPLAIRICAASINVTVNL